MKLGMTAVPVFAPFWDGLGLFTTALLTWTFLTPHQPESPSLYLPPFIVGAMLGLGKSRRTWRLHVGGAVVYGLALLAFATAIIYYTNGPWNDLLDVVQVIALLMIPLAIVSLVLSEKLFGFIRHRFRSR
jgi:peptidoglycan/LPS O-acetylase OafA/YrhL